MGRKVGGSSVWEERLRSGGGLRGMRSYGGAVTVFGVGGWWELKGYYGFGVSLGGICI